jgi:formylglycine-generating enzyme required for sulfatase activity
MWQTHQLSLMAAAGVLGVYLGVLWIKPLWLLKLPSTDITVPWTSWKVPLGVVRSLKYRDRVLDAWVQQHCQMAQTQFLELKSVKDRKLHISLPVQLHETLINELRGQDLAPTFKNKTAVLLITGEGGAGKTSLACQVAQWGLEQCLSSHSMLPVLIETELDDHKPLLEIIRGQLNALTNQAESILPELLERLLRRQRILVIVDHLSEMGDTTRKQVTPELADFPAKALVVTSRLDEPLGNVPKTILKPLQIEGSRLSRFMDAYLDLRKKRDLFEDEDYFDACRRLSRMVGQRRITVLLARLYADQMIEQQQGEGGILPDSVPELMLSYLNQLNRTIEPAQQRDNLHVQRDAQAIAWQCLKQTYRPTAAPRADAIAALETVAKDDAGDRLDYLEKRLRLLQTLEPGDKIRLILDPLAEYLAAIWLVADYRTQAHPEPCWRQFLQSIDTLLDQSNETPEAIQGFLLAVRDCCEVKQMEARIPEFIPVELARKAGLNPEELRQMQEKRRIRLLISDLSAPELDYRIRAAQDLGNWGNAASPAVPNLLGMLENRNQTSEARQAAAQTLGKLGLGSHSRRDDIAARLLALLHEDSEEIAVRRSAAAALGMMKTGTTQLLNILESDRHPLPVRQGAASAISRIGAPSGEPVPMLIVVELQGGEAIAQVKSIPVWKETLTETITLDLVSIPGGEFCMGSPPDEVGRDWYPYSYPDTEGLDVETQHQVTVPPFWIGQFPITQAQWRVVAALPKVERDLDPDPANFKGGDRPVELVSWYEAVEFCARLSQHTGKTYRLPSEAEWEYACRAGTIAPFHFGDTLATERANYDGSRYTYGPGILGEFRNQTTAVGQFGVVNRFGLADMHGNVWEWCLDYWHPSYDGAPIDGSAWVTDGGDRYRLLRGGSWNNVPGYCRSAIRNRYTPGYQNNLIGFRVVCVSPWTV